MIAGYVATYLRTIHAGRLRPRHRTATNMAADMDVRQRFFPHTQDELKEIASDILRHAKSLGGTDAATEISEGDGLSVSVRRGEVETIEHNRDKMVGVTVFIGNKRGNASTSDFSPQALKDTVAAAYNIARFTAEDDCAGLAEAELLETAPRDLDLYHPWNLDRRRSRRDRPPLRRRRVRDRSADQEFGRRERLGAALAVRAGHLARLPRAAIRIRATTSRARRSPAAAATCSATTGTRRSAAPANWPIRKPSAVTRRSARWRALARAASTRARCRCCSRRRSRPACSARSCRR